MASLVSIRCHCSNNFVHRYLSDCFHCLGGLIFLKTFWKSTNEPEFWPRLQYTHMCGTQMTWSLIYRKILYLSSNKMKFAEHLGAHITPEWRKQYIQYEVSLRFISSFLLYTNFSIILAHSGLDIQGNFPLDQRTSRISELLVLAHFKWSR